MILSLFKSQLLGNLFYIINIVGLIYTLTCNCIYIDKQIAVYSVNGKANLQIDLRSLILISFSNRYK